MSKGDGSVDEITWGMGSMGVVGNGANPTGTTAPKGAHPAPGMGRNVAASLLYRNGGNGDDPNMLTRSSSAPPTLHEMLDEGGVHDPDHKGVESILENAFDNDGVDHGPSGGRFLDGFAYGRTATAASPRLLEPSRSLKHPSYLIASKKGTEAAESPMAQQAIVHPKPSTPTAGAVGERSNRNAPLAEHDIVGGAAVSPWGKTSMERLQTDDLPQSPKLQSFGRSHGGAKSSSHIPSFDVPNDDADNQRGIWGPMPRAPSPIVAPTPLARNTPSFRQISAPGSPLLSRSLNATPLQNAVISQPGRGGGQGGQQIKHSMQPQQQPQHGQQQPQQPGIHLQQSPQSHKSQGGQMQQQHVKSPVMHGPGQQQMFSPVVAQVNQMPPLSQVPIFSPEADFSTANNYGEFMGDFGSMPGVGTNSLPNNGANNGGAEGLMQAQFPLNVNPSNVYYPNANPLNEGGVPAEHMKNMSLQQMQMIVAQQLYLTQMAAINVAASRSSASTISSPFTNSPGIGRSTSGWDIPDRDQVGVIGSVDARRASPQSNQGFGPEHSKKKNGDAQSSNLMNRRPLQQRRRRYDDSATYGDRKANNGGVFSSAELSHTRSPLLEQFRATSSSVRPPGGDGQGGVMPLVPLQGSPVRDWQLFELKGHVVEFATDQHGSRFIQQKLENSSSEDVEIVLNEALSEVQRLMMDVFGNYVVQKLLEYGGQSAIDAIAAELKSRMLTLSLHMYGCRVVQKALEVLESGPRAELVRELDGYILKCIHDQNGNHVIQKCVELVEPENVQFIVDEVVEQAVDLAEHSYGCRVVQRILEYGSNEQKEPIMMKIMISVQQLINDQYGNYVIQHVVEHGTEEERKVIIDIARRDIFGLSQHKFASNVVERCLQHGTVEQRRELIEMFIVGDGPPNPSPLSHLVRDQYGNYVVQRILDIAESSQRERVVEILREQVSAIKKYSYGKHIIARLEPGWQRQNPIQRQANNSVFT